MTGRLVLHIGTMKSGTTFVQHGLASQRERLEELGWLYPKLGGRGTDFNHQGAVYSAFPEQIPWIVTAQQAEPGEVLLSTSRTDPRDLLVSAEALSSVAAEDIPGLVAAFGRDDVRVVITARDLARVVISAWQQGVKSGTGQSLGGYLTGVNRAREGDTPSPFWRDFDLAALVGRWADVVGHERVTVVTLPQRGADPALLWQRFVRAAGLPEQMLDSAPADDHGSANISLRVPEIEFLLALNRLYGGRHRLTRAGIDSRAWLVSQWQEARGTDDELPGSPLRVPEDRVDDVRAWADDQVARCRELACGLEGDWSDLLVADGIPVGERNQGEPAGPDQAAALAVAADAFIRTWEYDVERMRLNTKFFRDREMRNRVRRQVRKMRGRPVD